MFKNIFFCSFYVTLSQLAKNQGFRFNSLNGVACGKCKDKEEKKIRTDMKSHENINFQ